MNIRSVSAITGICAAVVLGVSQATAADAPAPGEAAERAKLVGVWKGFTVVGKGEQPDRGPVKLELTFKEHAIRGIELKKDGNVDHGEGTFTLDLKADPKIMDATQVNARGRKTEYPGIYSLEGDTLKWCVGRQKVRPTTFETVKGQFLLILKREKK